MSFVKMVGKMGGGLRRGAGDATASVPIGRTKRNRQREVKRNSSILLLSPVSCEVVGPWDRRSSPKLQQVEKKNNLGKKTETFIIFILNFVRWVRII
jgi:hypothetical protein